MIILERYVTDIQSYEEEKQALELMCTCGHPLKSHAYVSLPIRFTYPNSLFPSQCCACTAHSTHFECEHWTYKERVLNEPV